MITNIRAGLQHILATAPQLPKSARWQALVTYIVDKILAAKSRICHSPTATASPRLALNTS